MTFRNPSLGLLVGLGALLLGFPLVEQSEHARTVLNVLGVVVGLLATRMVLHRWADRLFFACLYWLLEFARPGSFISAYPVRASGEITWYEYVYFSFTTLSTTGFGDTTPRTSFARAVVMTEQFTGVMYVALVIAHLTSLAATRKLR